MSSKKIKHGFDVCNVVQNNVGQWLVYCYGFLKGVRPTRKEAEQLRDEVNRYESQFPNP